MNGIAGAIGAVAWISGKPGWALAVLAVVCGFAAGALWQWGRRDADPAD